MFPRPPGTAIRTVLLDLAGPLAVFYGLRSAGVDDLTALAAGSVPPLLHIVLTAARERRLAPMPVLALVAVLAGLVSALAAGDVRDLLARDAAITAPFGLWMLSTLWGPRPFCFTATRALLPRRAVLMDRLWSAEPGFRRVWRIDTAIWGTVGLADSALRVLMAYTLPVAAVPALGAALSVITLLGLQAPTHLLLRSSGHWRALFARSRPPEIAPDRSLERVGRPLNPCRGGNPCRSAPGSTPAAARAVSHASPTVSPRPCPPAGSGPTASCRWRSPVGAPAGGCPCRSSSPTSGESATSCRCWART